MTAQFLPPVMILFVGLLSLSSAFQITSTSHQKAVTKLDALSRREVLEASKKVSAAMLFVGTTAPLMTPAPAFANSVAKTDKQVAEKYFFNGLFRDQKNPDGYRIVTGAVNKPGSVTFKDTTDGKGIDVPMMAVKDEETGKVTLKMDLTPYDAKKYPGEVVATVKKDGCIQFPDGNLWQKVGGVYGVYIDGFAPYPKYRRLVLPGKGDDLVVTLVSGKQVFDTTGVDLGKKGLYVDFPSKQCTGKVNRKKGTIAWADGNSWTKV